MLTESRIAVWPATGVTSGLVDIQNYFGNNILKRFPPGFINTYHFDTKVGFRTVYKNTRASILKNGRRAQFQEQKRPRLTIVFDNRDDKQEDAAGGIEQPYTYPLTQGVHPDMHGYVPIYRDKYGIELYYSHKRIKYNFSGILETESLADQENSLIILENILKVQYGAMLEGIHARFILPNDMMKMIYRIQNFEDIKQICENREMDDEDKDEEFKKVEANFEANLKEYSNCNLIYPMVRNKNSKDKFYIYDQIYKKMYFQLTDQPQKQDGEKLGSIYSKFTVTFEGFLEFEKPISYIMKCPEMVNGNLVSDIVEYKGDLNFFRDYNPMGYSKYFKRPVDQMPTRIIEEVRYKGLKLVYYEKDIAFTYPSDYLELAEWMMDKKDADPDIITFLRTLKNDTEFKKYFKIYIYNDTYDTYIDDSDISWDGEILHIASVSEASQYRLYIFANEGDLKVMTRKLKLEMEEKRDEYTEYDQQ